MEMEESGRAPQTQAEHWRENSHDSVEKQHGKGFRPQPIKIPPLDLRAEGEVVPSFTRKSPEALNRLDLVM